MKKKLLKNIVWFLFLNSTYVFSQTYYTSQRVFSDRFPEEIMDYSQKTYIKIKNTRGDIIVAIEDVNKRRVIQHSYIIAYGTYSFKNIPFGRYVAKYMWTDTHGNRRYEKDNSFMEFEVDNIGGYVITLQETTYGNLSQSDISESEFFNN